MLRNFLRRLLLLPPALLLVNFFGFAYAHYGRWVQLSRNPMFAVRSAPDPVWPLYLEYWQGILKGDLGKMPGVSAFTIQEIILSSTKNSLGLLGIVILISIVLGMVLGLVAVRTNPPRIAGWLIPLSTVNLAMPSFYVGAILIAASIYYLLFIPGGNRQLPLPVNGFGWDDHLVFPVIALMVRPTMQIAQTVATLLANELRQPYVTAARSFGHTWRLIRWKTALRNVFAPVVVTFASSFRLLVGEMLLVEMLFSWPGLGRLLAKSLEPPSTASIGRATLPDTFLHPPMVACILVIFAALFLFADLIASLGSCLADPRMRLQEEAGNV